MRRRQQFPAPPPAKDTDSVRAARAMAAAINQGLPGGQFCNLMNVMNGATVKTAAGFTLAEVVAWFHEDPDAAAILRGCPSFESFAQAFHVRAREIYPPPAEPPPAA